MRDLSVLSVAREIRVGGSVAHLDGQPVVGHVEGLQLLGPDQPHRTRPRVQDIDQLQGHVLNPGEEIGLCYL